MTLERRTQNTSCGHAGKASWRQSFSRVRLSATLWTAACQAPLSRESPGKNPGVGSLSLLQRIFPTQGSNPSLLHCRRILYQLNHQASRAAPSLSTAVTELAGGCERTPAGQRLAVSFSENGGWRGSPVPTGSWSRGRPGCLESQVLRPPDPGPAPRPCSRAR